MTSASAGRSNILMQWRKCWSIPRLYHHPRSQINIMSSTGTSRPLISPSASVPARSGFGFARRWHLDLFGLSMWICAQKHLYFSWILLSIFSQFSVVNFTGCWMASYFPVKLPRKENHFWHSLHLKLKRRIFRRTPIGFPARNWLPPPCCYTNMREQK